MPINEVPIKKFLGLNLKDAADQVKDNEFIQLQNVYQPSRGVLSIRFGSEIDLTEAVFPLCSRISGLWRHSGPYQNTTLYHCVPDTNPIPDPTLDLTLTDTADGLGTIFKGGSVVNIQVCYAWVGSGVESSFNTKNRTGYVATQDIHAATQTAHQHITLGGNTNSLKIQCPTFPTGVRAANIFVAVAYSAEPSEMVYVGSITTSGGFIYFRRYVGVVAAINDAFSGTITVSQGLTGSGSIQPGTYYIGFAWLTNNGQVENPSTGFACAPANLNPTITTVQVTNVNSSIIISHDFSDSSNGAKDTYVFVGTLPQAFSPMTMVGITKANESLSVLAIPSHNGQTHPFTLGPYYPGFFNEVNSTGVATTLRNGFMLAKNSGALYEIFPSRSIFWYGAASGGNLDPTLPQVGGSAQVLVNGPPYYFGGPKTQNDNYGGTQPHNWGFPVLDPVFAHQDGLTFFVNGVDITWYTDGYTMGQIVPVNAGLATGGSWSSALQTLLPTPLKSVGAYQGALVGIQSVNGNQLFSANAGTFGTNWATGGSGPALIYVTTGDPFGGGCSALGIFTPITNATNNPSSFLIGFKKSGTWMVSSVTQPTASAVAGLTGGQIAGNMVQVSGSVGCVAPKSVVQTPLGTVFFGTEANIFLINGVREPQRIGTKVQNLLIHLVGNDAAMQQVTAVYHDRHYKMSYPSPAAVAAGAPYVNDYELWADLRTEEGPIIWVGPHVGRNIGSQVVLAGDGDDMSRLVVDSALFRTYTADSINTLTDLNSMNAGQTIVVQITGKQFRFNSDSHFKRYFGVIFDVYLDLSYNNTILLEGFADGYYGSINRTLSTGGGIWDSSQWDQTTFADAIWQGYSFNFPSQVNLIGRTFQMRITKSDQSPFVLASATLSLKNEKRMLVN